MEDLESSYKEMAKRDAATAKLIKFIDTTVQQFQGIMEKIDKAVAAVAELSKMFKAQEESYNMISDNLEKIKNGATQDLDIDTRAAFFNTYIARSITQIQNVSCLVVNKDTLMTFFSPLKLQTAAAGFVKAILEEDRSAFDKLA